MKHRTDGEHAGYSWERPPQQPATVEVLHSIERSDLTSAFGTSTPPAGPSGAIRRFAFRYSASSYGHWLPLLPADRVGAAGGAGRAGACGGVACRYSESSYGRGLPLMLADRVGVAEGVVKDLKSGRVPNVL